MSKHPDFTQIKKQNKNYKTNFHSALQYAHYEFNPSDLKKETLKYLKSIGSNKELLSGVISINDSKLSVFGKYAFILNHGGELPDDVYNSFLPTIEKIVKEELNKKPSNFDVTPIVSDEPVAAPNIQERLLDNCKVVGSDINGWLDDLIVNKSDTVKTVDDFVAIFQSYGLKGPHMPHIINMFENSSKEITLVLSGEDKQLVEAYSNFTKKQLKNLNTFFKNLEDACLKLQEISKISRTPKKKKPISKEKQASKIKYKKEDSMLGITSIHPSNIIGAKDVWVYNTKTRKLAQYKAFDQRGLLINGNSIDNFSLDSVEKMIRMPSETLSELKNSGKVKLKTFLNNIPTIDIKVNGKLTEHHLILRIEK